MKKPIKCKYWDKCSNKFKDDLDVVYLYCKDCCEFTPVYLEDSEED
jgi:hypothetical protein